jgi:Superfamily II helicase and inactivated derivatives
MSHYALYKHHTLINDPEPIGIKITIRRLLKEKKSVYEIMINDEFPYVPSFGFEKLDEIAIEIAAQCSKYLFRFDMTLFQKYLNIKLKEYRQKNNGILKECIISKTTGWNENNTMFFHYDLNDESHELHKDNPLYKYHKAQSFNQEEQHEFVLKLLEEGELLGVLLVISASSIGLKPFNLQPLTCILAGNPGAGKTTASLIATSLFYKSDTILLNANATNVGIELTLSSLNSLPFVIDEGALADVGVSLKHTIFSVASGKGRTRGRKDLTVDTKDIISNVFWTTETTDIDEIKRGGAFRRMLYLVVEQWENFTKRYNLTDDEDRPNERFSGCGVDYIKFAVKNLSMLEKRFNKETRDFVAKYREITGIATTLYFGIILLEEYYSYRLNQKIVFQQLRNKVNQILEDTKKTFVLSKDNVVELLQQYLYNNQHRSADGIK